MSLCNMSNVGVIATRHPGPVPLSAYCQPLHCPDEVKTKGGNLEKKHTHYKTDLFPGNTTIIHFSRPYKA